MISYPASKTIKSGFLKEDSPATEYHPQSETLNHHVKAHSLEKRMLAYIAETYRITSGTMDEMIYLSQLVQSEAMYIAYRGWRQKWGKREAGGVLVWQINDCWPVTSWAIVDYYFRPKMAFYSIARALKPVTLIGRRFTTDPKPNNKVEEMVRSKSTKTLGKGKLHSIPHTYPPIKSHVEIVISSIASTDTKGLSLSIDYMSILTGDKKTVKTVDSVEIGSNETVMLFAEEVPVDPPTVVVATLKDSDGKVVHQELEWPEPLKWVAMPDPGFKTHVKEEEGSAFVEVEVERPTKALWFQEEDGETWSDNGIDVVPGDKVVLKVDGFVERKLKAVFYGLHRQ
jgi:beta-mannosidase